MTFIGDVISSDTSEYKVKQILGSGGFGTVALCKKKPTNNFVALKIISNKKAIASSENETKFLCLMRSLGSHQFNIVQWFTSFMAGEKYCLEFERLDISLHEYIKTYIIQLQDIRPIVQQMAEALSFLKEAGIVHADLKPANIMMVNHVHHPLKVKLIDFGLAIDDPERRTGSRRGTLWYRAPELLLGAPYNHAIDTWALGCTAAQMLLSVPLFKAPNDTKALRMIVWIIGQPPDTVMNFGVHTEKFFSNSMTDLTRGWSLKSPVDPDTELFPISTLADLLEFTEETDDPEEERDGASFVDLITKMLDVDHYNRITPADILGHPFLTLSHLDSSHSRYAQSSIQIMKSCPNWWVAEEEDAPRCSETSSRESPSTQNAGKKRSRDSEQHSQQASKKSCSRSDCSSPQRKRRKISPGEDVKKTISKDTSTAVTTKAAPTTGDRRKKEEQGGN